MTGSRTMQRWLAILAAGVVALAVFAGPAAAQEEEPAPVPVGIGVDVDGDGICDEVDTGTAVPDTDTACGIPSVATDAGGTGGEAEGADGGGTRAVGGAAGLPNRIDAGVGGIAVLAQACRAAGGGGDSGALAPDSSTADEDISVDTETGVSGDASFGSASYRAGVRASAAIGGGTDCPEAGIAGAADGLPTRIDAGAGAAAAATPSAVPYTLTAMAGLAAAFESIRRRRR